MTNASIKTTYDGKPINRFNIGDRVTVKGDTKSSLTYGYVRSIGIGTYGYEVYFPKSGARGTGWSDWDFR